MKVENARQKHRIEELEANNGEERKGGEKNDDDKESSDDEPSPVARERPGLGGPNQQERDIMLQLMMGNMLMVRHDDA